MDVVQSAFMSEIKKTFRVVCVHVDARPKRNRRPISEVELANSCPPEGLVRETEEADRKMNESTKGAQKKA